MDAVMAILLALLSMFFTWLITRDYYLRSSNEAKMIMDSLEQKGVVEYNRDRLGKIKGIKRIINISDVVQSQTTDNVNIGIHPPEK
jgi:hypothetical protein